MVLIGLLVCVVLLLLRLCVRVRVCLCLWMCGDGGVKQLLTSSCNSSHVLALLREERCDHTMWTLSPAQLTVGCLCRILKIGVI